MHTFKQTREIFDLSRQFHHQLSDFYAEMAESAEKKRVMLLLDYLSRHECNLESCLEAYERMTPNPVLKSWFQYVPDARPLAHLGELKLAPDMTVEQVVELALKLDEALVEFYRELADESEAEEVRELFENLLLMEENDEIALKRDGLVV